MSWIVEAVESAAELRVIERLRNEAGATISGLGGSLHFEVKLGDEEQLGDWEWLVFGEDQILAGIAAWHRKYPDDEADDRKLLVEALRRFADRIEGK